MTTPPKVLIVYYSYTQQTRLVAEAAAEVFRLRACEVRLAAIEFTEERYVKQFTVFPFRHVYIDLFKMLPAHLARKTGSIQFPEDVISEDYDLVCIGSPTWWLTTCMPIRSFLRSEAAHRLLSGKAFASFVVCRRYWRNNLNTVKRLGEKQGGRFVDGIHFVYEGGQIRSMLSLISYLGSGQYRARYLGLRIPRTNLKSDYLQVTRAFADRLADRLIGAGQA
jgi:menaquinone-dependent protoporphyrinogen IX oxidase